MKNIVRGALALAVLALPSVVLASEPVKTALCGCCAACGCC